MTAEIFLLRHGETEWNAAGRFQGQLDSSLTPRGRDQVKHLGRILVSALAGRSPPPVHVSPLGRTRDTAALLRGSVPALGIEILEPRLQEVLSGAWDGRTRAEIEAGWPGQLDGANHYDWYSEHPMAKPTPPHFSACRSGLMSWKGRWSPCRMACSGGSCEEPG